MQKVILVDIVKRNFNSSRRLLRRCRTFTPDSKSSAGKRTVRLFKKLDLSEGADVVAEASGTKPSLLMSKHVLRIGRSLRSRRTKASEVWSSDGRYVGRS